MRPGCPLACLLLLVLAAGCAGPQPRADAWLDELVTSPGWQRIDLHGIELYTDTDPEEARRIATRLSAFLNVLEIVGGVEVFSPNRPTQLIVFDEQADWARFRVAHSLGVAAYGPRAFVVALSAQGETYNTLYHEMVHLALFMDPGPFHPRWFHEGLAEVFGTTLIMEDVARVGRVPNERWQQLSKADSLPLSEVLSGRAASRSSAAFYADAFAFTHFGLFGQPAGSGSSLRQLVSLQRHGVRWEKALAVAFEGDPGAVEDAYRTHRSRLVSRGSGEIVIELTRAPVAFQAQPAASHDLARALARLGESSGLDPTRTDRLWEMVLQHRPEDDEALIGRARAAALMDRPEAAANFIVAVPRGLANEIDHALASGAIAMARYRASQAEGKPGRENLMAARQAYEFVLERWPDHAGSLWALGQCYVLDDAIPPQRGIEVLQDFDRLLPGDSDVMLALGELYIRAGSAEAARRLLRMVVDLAPGSEEATRAEGLLASLEYESAS